VTTELDAFYAAMRGTKVLTQDKVPLSRQKTIPARVRRHLPSSPLTVVLEETTHPTVAANDRLSHRDISISHKMLRKLRNGQYNVDARLDLHGMTVEAARGAVSQFLSYCLEENKRVALIIHGKGRQETPILKNKVNQWLRGAKCVLAFTSAALPHGGSGAVYVLLRRENST